MRNSSAHAPVFEIVGWQGRNAMPSDELDDYPWLVVGVEPAMRWRRALKARYLASQKERKMASPSIDAL